MAGLHKLSARGVETIDRPGRHGDGGGLWFVVDKPRADGSRGARRWLFLFRWGGKLKEMGLGGFPAVSLAKARQKAQAARELLAEGRSPLDARRQQETDRAVLFGEFADELIASLRPQWRNEKHAAQWSMTLTRYAEPLRALPLDAIDTAHVLTCLRPIWTTKPETASRVRARIENVLDAAKARGLRTGDNAARWRGHLDHLLPRRQKLSRGHHAAAPYAELPAFMAALRMRQGTAASALEFCILTAARTGEIRGARWSEIDLEGATWTVPAIRMKAGREHRAALSVEALAVLDRMQGGGGQLIFPGYRAPPAGGVVEAMLSDGALERVLDRMSLAWPATVHGFRSSFRDWVYEATDFPGELAEAALAHVTGNATERAYRRGDALDRRRQLMKAWAEFCAGH